MSENLMEGLLKELNRNREILVEYEKIPAGFFGAAMIKQGIAIAEKAIGENDIVQMLKSYQDLQGTC